MVPKSQLKPFCQPIPPNLKINNVSVILESMLKTQVTIHVPSCENKGKSVKTIGNKIPNQNFETITMNYIINRVNLNKNSQKILMEQHKIHLYHCSEFEFIIILRLGNKQESIYKHRHKP